MCKKEELKKLCDELEEVIKNFYSLQALVKVAKHLSECIIGIKDPIEDSEDITAESLFALCEMVDNTFQKYTDKIQKIHHRFEMFEFSFKQNFCKHQSSH